MVRVLPSQYNYLLELANGVVGSAVLTTPENEFPSIESMAAAIEGVNSSKSKPSLEGATRVSEVDLVCTAATAASMASAMEGVNSEDIADNPDD